MVPPETVLTYPLFLSMKDSSVALPCVNLNFIIRMQESLVMAHVASGTSFMQSWCS